MLSIFFKNVFYIFKNAFYIFSFFKEVFLFKRVLKQPDRKEYSNLKGSVITMACHSFFSIQSKKGGMLCHVK